MEISSDPYEQKLYQMFENHVNSDGYLDIDSLKCLCKTLELKDKTQILIKCLLNNGKNTVTFREFKDGLLKFLGNEMTSVNDQLGHNLTENDDDDEDDDEQTTTATSTKATIKPKVTEITTTTASVTTTTTKNNSGINSPLREVQPKFIVGSKKYGRRSKPNNIIDINNEQTTSLSDSDNETVQPGAVSLTSVSSTSVVTSKKQQKNLTKSQNRVQRSSSQSDIHGNSTTKRRRPVGGTKLKRCASLPAQQKPKNDNMNLTRKVPSQLDSSVDSLANDSTLVSSEDIIDMWETAGIGQANSLLLSLGFAENQFQISELSTALDDELQTSHGDSGTSPMLRASLVLHKAEVNALRQALKQLDAENRKLHADNKDSNRRAVILAQEIDERHAALENTTKAEIKSLEQRHNELVRELTTQLSTEREHWSNISSRLETRIKLMESDEIKIKNELFLYKDENSALEKEQTSLHKQLTELLETNIKLNNEISEIEEKYKNDEHLKNNMENEEVIELIEKISSLQIENSNLRDKNDELSAEIEGLNVELKRVKTKKQLNRSMSVQESSTINNSNVTTTTTDYDDPNVPPIEIEQNQSVAIKRRGDSPSKTRVTEESPRLGKFRKCNNDDNTGTESETSGDWMALNSELCQTILTTSTVGVNGITAPATSSTSGFSQDYSSLNDSGKDDEMKNLKIKLEQLEKELDKYKNNIKEKMSDNPEEMEKIKEENKRMETRCNELEYSLEQMRKEYEDCEDYWQSKLTEERLLYEEEQRISDEKLSELLRKMSEYEEQFSATIEKDGRLSPIDENCRLEQQFSELEAETEEIKAHAQKLLEDKEDEVAKLQFKIKELQKKLNDSDMISQTTPPPRVTPDVESPASSPINYLWSQSTIHGPARDYQNPNWNNKNSQDSQMDPSIWNTINNTIEEQLPGSITRTVSPIQKPKSIENGVIDNSDIASIGSGRSLGSHSVASTYNVHKAASPESFCPSPNIMKEDIKRLKVIEIQLREEIKDLCQQRDGIVMELQQLQEAKPAFEKAYARAAHPSLTTRIQQLEQKNRHLQNSLRQQNQYVESIMHQTWHQQRAEINELRNRLETQNIIISEQAQRLTNADILVKDLYVENSHLTATIQRLEQQRNRAGMIQLQHQQGISGLSGMP